MRSTTQALYGVARRARRLLPLFTLGGALSIACSAKLPGGASGTSDTSWVCTDTQVLDTPCRCQTSPLGGVVHITDHCDRTMVPDDAGIADVRCCKESIVLNGQSHPYFCFCVPSNGRKCDLANGDEVVDRCP